MIITARIFVSLFVLNYIYLENIPPLGNCCKFGHKNLRDVWINLTAQLQPYPVRFNIDILPAEPT